ncbi:extracellular solute-binding protein [Halobellus limi]|jgi:ABC-type glycerol-3-phosphate transport system substrate-binding protein|uniref:ABC-type glycerol-3-phosphate transport system, substrate-binding protein n=1 Tax=Halobellus limi TaxID=699433 RepID=A0A1H6C3N3_9EURY|nr:extracellular solute-binding protein [Halobellus limi]QCC48591.1 extracellular solute-binding protein [Halobellus limi]SEG67571.1 ABC-type glycerol-3-phosphate transport system, substrate-binding protein [Halobellus limi]
MPQDSTSNGVSRRQYLAATGALGAVGLAGCSGGGNGDGSGDGGGDGGSTDTPIGTSTSDEEVTIQIAADSNFANAADEISQTLHEDGGLPDNISIEFLAGSFTTGDRRSQYQQILSAGQGRPTVMMMDNGWTIPFIARGQIANLSQVLPSSITDTVTNDYLQNMVATAQGPNGDLFGIPLFADFPTIQYRKDLMREAGYSDSDFDTWATEPMTWQEFSQVVRETMDATDTQMGFTWQGSAYEGLSCCDFIEFMGSHGGSYFGEFENYFGPIGDRPVTVDQENVINAVRMMRTFIYGQDDDEALEGYADISPDAVVQYTEEPSREPFTNGDAVAHRNWPYSININGAEDAFGEDLGVMPIPYAVSQEDSPYESIGGSTSALGGWHLTLNPNANDARKQAAVQLFRALQTDEVRLRMFEIGGWTPPIADLINTERTRQLELIGRYVDTLQVAGEAALPRPVTPVWPQQSDQIATEVNAALRQEKSSSEAMESLQASLESIESQA